jgi:branched-chain amino acid transport system substrate-binding protein
MWGNKGESLARQRVQSGATKSPLLIGRAVDQELDPSPGSCCGDYKNRPQEVKLTKVNRREHSMLVVGSGLLLAAVVAAGCGSSGGSSNSASATTAGGTSGTSGTSGGTSSSGTITVMALGVYSSPVFSVPQAADAVELAAAQINKAGGINGKQLKVITCNEQNNPSIAAQCAQKAVSDHVAALVGRTTLNGDAVVPILQKAQIPDIGPIDFSPADASGDNTVSFVISTVGTPGTVSATLALAKSGCKSIAAVYSSPGGSPEIPAFQSTVKALGLKDAGSFGVSQESTNWAPAFQSAVQGGGKSVCSVIIASAAQEVGVFQGISQSTAPHMQVATYSNALPLSVAPTLGGKATGAITTSGFAFPDTAAAASFVAAFTKAYPKASLDEQSLNAYIATNIFASVAKTLKTVNSSNVLAALRKDTDVTSPLLPATLDFTKINSASAFARLFNPNMNAVQITSSGSKPLFGGQNISIESYLQKVPS